MTIASMVTSLTIPQCFSHDIKVDGNSARQLLIPAQTVIFDARNAEALSIGLLDGTSRRLIRHRKLLGDSELALCVPGNVPLETLVDLRNATDAKWIGRRNASTPDEALISLRDRFHWIQDDPDNGVKGLRQPQVGAIHSVLGYWTTDPRDAATVVMPTGTGKTETMLALFAHERLPRLLIVVPSDVLRSQIALKFETLGVLRAFGIVDQRSLLPVVGQMKHRFASRDSAIEFANACNVIVTTPNALHAAGKDVSGALAERCSHLFVDEAHHVAATTWREIRDSFGRKPVVQFTATPYREDGRHLGGRLLYTFPLREAQRQRYFSQINYHSVIEFDDGDRAIADAAITHLRADIAAGFDHLIMARVRRIGRAAEILALYRELAQDLNPVVVHSTSPVRERRRAMELLYSRASRIVVCVDMLGEGFDLPSLKIAAIHDPHKSLGVTLQFIGRFARVTGTSIGQATVIAGRPEMEFDDTLRRLYAEDPDWNVLIRDLSEKAVQEQQTVGDFDEAFSSLPDDIALASLIPKMSTVVYGTAPTEWRPDNAVQVFGEDQILTLPIPINERDRVAWFVTELHDAVSWGDVKSLQEIAYNLYVLYWDEERKLLYINCSDTDSLHEDLAKAVCGDSVQRFTGEVVYRVMAAVKRLVPTNVGVLDVRNRARRFSMHVGADVSEGFPVAEAQTKTKTNIFAYGFEDGQRVSIGASLKGRIWSYRVATSLKYWMDWCNYIGTKLTDDAINIDSVMESFIRPKVLTERPRLVALGAEWPWEVFLSTSEETRLERAGTEWPLVDADIRIASHAETGPILFDIVTPDWTARYEAAFGATAVTYACRSKGPEVSVISRHYSQPLSVFLAKNGLMFLMEHDATIVHPGLLLRPTRDLPPFDPSMLETLDWSNINIRKESQGPNRDQDSVQARTLDHLLTLSNWDVVIDDDGSGEIADLVAIAGDDTILRVTLVHCKYSSGDIPGARLKDLYEVCGQAQKSGKWKRSVEHMFRQLIRREKKRVQRIGRSGLMKGDVRQLYALYDRARYLQPQFSVIIAQPGLSKAKVSAGLLELLASSEVYLHEIALAPLTVICSH